MLHGIWATKAWVKCCLSKIKNKTRIAFSATGLTRFNRFIRSEIFEVWISDISFFFLNKTTSFLTSRDWVEEMGHPRKKKQNICTCRIGEIPGARVSFSQTPIHKSNKIKNSQFSVFVRCWPGDEYWSQRNSVELIVDEKIRSSDWPIFFP